jgi:perosamine synthetase
MDEMSAALGLSQFKRIEEILDRREAVARCYAERLRALPEVGIPGAVAGGRRSWFVYVVTLPDGCDRDETIEGMEEDGVPARGYFSPIHTQAYIRRLYGDLEGTLPVTEAMARRTLALPFHVHLTDAEMDRVVASLTKNMT